MGELTAPFAELEKSLYQVVQATLDEILPQAYATVKEAARRLVGTEVQVTGQTLVWDMVPYHVQIIGGTALHEAVERGQVGYLSAAPLRVMAEACARWQQRHHGWDVPADMIRAVPDVLGALEVACRHYLPAGAMVAVPVPCYMPFLPLLALLGHPVVQVPMLRGEGDWSLDEAALDAAFAAGARMLLLCNPHNPIGKVYARAELQRIATIAARHDARVFADEIHAPLVYPGHRHVPYATVSADAARQAITAVSASKAWNLAGLKCAQLIFTRPDDLQRWREVGHFAGNSTSTLGVVAHTAA